MNTASIRRASRDVMRALSLEVLASNASSTSAKEAFRSYAKLLHPDAYPADLDDAVRREAEAAFKHLMSLKDTPNPTTGHATRQVITTLRGSHVITGSCNQGDIAATFTAESSLSGAVRRTFVKLARHPSDNDLLDVEAAILRKFDGVAPQFRAFLPELVDDATVNNEGRQCRANVVGWLDGFVTLEEVKRAFPAGVPAVDAVWMWRRLLVALASAHDVKVVHGAVLPTNVMIHPAQHGLVLVDWCYGSLGGSSSYEPLKAIVGARRDWYPQEVFDKKSPSPATDIALAAKTMVYVLGGDPVLGTVPASVPRALRAFFKGCTASSQAARPQNAWLLLQEFDELLEAMGAPYYPRRFRPFTLPNIG